MGWWSVSRSQLSILTLRLGPFFRFCSLNILSTVNGQILQALVVVL